MSKQQALLTDNRMEPSAFPKSYNSIKGCEADVQVVKFQKNKIALFDKQISDPLVSPSKSVLNKKRSFDSILPNPMERDNVIDNSSHSPIKEKRLMLGSAHSNKTNKNLQIQIYHYQNSKKISRNPENEQLETKKVHSTRHYN